MKTFTLNAPAYVSTLWARSGNTYDVINGQITVNQYDLESALGAGFMFPESTTGGLTKTVADGYYSPIGALTKTQADTYYSAIGALTKTAADGYYSAIGALTQTTGDARYLQIPVSHTPTSPTDTGVVGTIAFDSSFLYQCIGTNSWVRFPIDATWGT